MHNRFRPTLISLFLVTAACGGDEFNDVAQDSDAGGAGGSSGIDGSVGGTSGGGNTSETGGQGGGSGLGGTGGTGGTGGETSDAGSDASLPDANLPEASPDAASPDADSPDVQLPDADPSCPIGFASCEGNDGECETNVSSNPNHCGGCGITCSDPGHATPTCVAGICGFSCLSGYDDCDSNPANGCEAALSSIQHCLGCGNVCPSVSHGKPTCLSSGCSFDCDTNWGDCDSNPANGCETNLAASVLHCGGCHSPCANRPNSDPVCISSKCEFSCYTGFQDCDGAVGNGCEINTTNNINHCGSCNHVCGSTNGVPSCSGGKCAIQCIAGFGNCDSKNSTGCETNVYTSMNHCGVCGNVCGTANGTAVCDVGSCKITCFANYADCDGVNGNGCEANLKTDAKNCGVCGRDCLNAQCVNGFCSPQSIATGFKFTLHDSWLYYTTADSLIRTLPGLPTMTTVLRSDLSLPVDPHVAGNRVYYAEYMVARIGSVVLSGMLTPSGVADAGSGPRSVKSGDGKLFWISNKKIWSAPPFQGTRTEVASADTSELVMDANYLYWASLPQNNVQRLRMSTGAVTTLASGENQPWDVALGGQNDVNLFWVNRGSGVVRRSNTNGYSKQALVTGQTSLSSIDATPEHVYWTTETGVYRARIDGSGVIQLATGQSKATDVLVHGNYVYWRDTDTIWRTTK